MNKKFENMFVIINILMITFLVASYIIKDAKIDYLENERIDLQNQVNGLKWNNEKERKFPVDL